MFCFFYIELVRWTELQAHPEKRGKLSATEEAPPDGLWSVASHPREWMARPRNREPLLRAIGSAEALMLKPADQWQQRRQWASCGLRDTRKKQVRSAVMRGGKAFRGNSLSRGSGNSQFPGSPYDQPVINRSIRAPRLPACRTIRPAKDFLLPRALNHAFLEDHFAPSSSGVVGGDPDSGAEIVGVLIFVLVFVDELM